ncbi:MAG: hypothetical protein WC525_00535 [Candidatus Thermoplasmatota archaeon]
MDDGIKTILLIIAVLLISLFFFVYVIKELSLVFLLIAIVLLTLLAYNCMMMVTTRWDSHKTTKEWDQVEELKKIQPTTVDTIIEEQKKQEQ